MNLVVKLLKKIRFNYEGTKFAKVINFLTFKRVNFLQVYRFEHRFNKKMSALIQRICKHPTTYDSHDWGGGFRHCSDCHKRLETLWLPQPGPKRKHG